MKKSLLIVCFLFLACTVHAGTAITGLEQETVAYSKISTLTNAQQAAVNKEIKAIKYASGIVLTGITAQVAYMGNVQPFLYADAVDWRKYIGFYASLSDGTKTIKAKILSAATEESLDATERLPQDLTVTWGTVGTSPVVDSATTFHTGGTGGVRVDNILSIGRIYKLVGITSQATQTWVNNYATSTPVVMTGSGTVYFTATTAGFYLRNPNALSTVIGSMTVKELLAPPSPGVMIGAPVVETGFNPMASLTATITKNPDALLTSDIQDNIYNNVTVPRQNSQARIKFVTTAESLTVNGTTTIYPYFPEYAHLGLRINGVEQSPLVFPDNGAESFTVNLGAGTKTVEITAGYVTARGCTGGICGSFIDNISPLPVPTAFITDPAASRTILYGDSITSGRGATNPESQSWGMLLRNTYGRSILVDAWGARSLYSDNLAGLDDFVAHLVKAAPANLYIAIGTNDYGLVGGRWSSSDFGTAYASLLDKLHAAMPTLLIYCQTPIYRANEDTENTFGETLDDYRAAIATAVSTRTAYTTLVDGTAILDGDDLDPTDNLHPTTAGHAKYAEAVDAILP